MTKSEAAERLAEAAQIVDSLLPVSPHWAKCNDAIAQLSIALVAYHAAEPDVNGNLNGERLPAGITLAQLWKALEHVQSYGCGPATQHRIWTAGAVHGVVWDVLRAIRDASSPPTR